MRRGTHRIIAVVGLAVIAVLAIAAPALGKPAADLAPSKVDAGAGAAAGQPLDVSFTVRNRGSGRASRSALTFHISENRRLDKRDLRFSGRARVKRLGPGRSARGEATVTVPRSADLGVYRLIACVGAPGLADAKPGNDCRPAGQRLGVTPRPQPLTVTAVPDEARASSAEISRGGGSLTATAADGTRFTLSVPEGALLSPEVITMTPLASIAGFPLSGGLAGGVQLAPEGLRLLRPATLRIEPSAPVGDDERTAFAYRGSGEEFHLHPSKSDGGAVALDLIHFSGYGVGSSTPAERAALAQSNPPSSVADIADQELAAGTELEAVALAMYGQILALSQGRETFDVAVLHYLSWSPLATRLALAGPLFASLPAQLDGQLARHIAEARVHCATATDLREAAWIMRLAAAARPLLGHVAAAESALDACLRFELDLDADITEPTEIEPTQVRAQAIGVPARLVTGLDPETFDAQRDLSVVSYTKSNWDCWTHRWDVGPADPVRMTSIRFDGLNPRGGLGPAPAVRSVSLDPGSLNESVTHTCDTTTYTEPQNVYRLGMLSAMGDGTVRGWTDAGGGAFRRDLTVGGGYTGLVTLVLRHTPVS